MADKIYSVYKHTNKANGKVYIGETGQDVKKRWNSGWGYENNSVFWKDIKEYGWNEGFTHEVLFTFDNEEEAIAKEIELIAFYKSNYRRYSNPTFGYNANDGGQGGYSQKVCQYDLDGNFIKVWDSMVQVSNELGLDMGSVHSCIVGRTRRSGNYMWRYYDEATFEEKIDGYDTYINGNSIPVCQYDLDGNFIKTWQSATKASNELNINVGTISHCCNGKLNIGGNYMWRYFEGEDMPEQIEPYTSPERAVCRYDIDGNLIDCWNSLSEAERQTGISNTIICNCCKGKNMTGGGFIWRYKESDNPPKKIEIKTLNRRLRPVVQYSKNGCYIQSFPSISEAARTLKLNPSHICAVCKGKRHTCGDYVWRYSDD